MELIRTFCKSIGFGVTSDERKIFDALQSKETKTIDIVGRGGLSMDANEAREQIRNRLHPDGAVLSSQAK